jgi:hypothetical protein
VGQSRASLQRGSVSRTRGCLQETTGIKRRYAKDRRDNRGKEWRLEGRRGREREETAVEEKRKKLGGGETAVILGVDIT